jgi:glycosyltransferase involved in cell wall biosynthesis
MATRSRLLIYTDHPCRKSGLGRIARELGQHLAGEYIVGYAGWGFDGDESEYPYSFFLPKTRGGGEEMHEFIRIADAFAPECVLMIGDPWDWGHIPEAKFNLKRTHPKMRFVMLLTIDGDPLRKEWTRNLVPADALGVTSEYGREKIVELSDAFDPQVVQLGVNTETFNIDKVCSLIPPNHNIRLSREKAFVLLWVGQNTHRKDLGSFLEISSEFVHEHENAYIIAVTQWDSPMGINVQDICERVKMPQDKFFLIETDGQRGPSDKHMANLYNVARVLVCTSIGEGNWMPGYEAQACGCIPIGTDCTAVPETIGDRGILVAPANKIYGEFDIARYYCDKPKILKHLHSMYEQWKDGSNLPQWQSKKCIAWAEEQTWGKMAECIKELIEQAGVTKKRSYVREHINLRDTRPLMVCPSYGSSCGIAEYTKSLVSAMISEGHEPMITTATDAEQIDLMTDSVSVVHFQHEHSFYGDGQAFFKALEVLRGKGIRTVVTMHSASPIHEYNEKTCRLADTVLVHSEQAKKVVGAHGLKGVDLRVMPMGCFFETIPWDQGKMRDALNIPRDRFIVGSYGYMRPDKGFDVVVNAVHMANQTTPGFMALIYSSPHEFGSSDFDKMFFDTLEKVVSEDEWLILRERLPKRDIMRAMNVCNVIALPYVRGAAGGGVSSAAKDMLLLGKPTVVTATDAFADIPGKCAIRIRQDDTVSLSSLIRKMREKPEDFSETGRNGRQYCWENRWTAVARKHIDLYDEEKT